MQKVIRTIQPPHESENITLEQARAAWIKAEAEMREARRRKRAAARAQRSEIGAVRKP